MNSKIDITTENYDAEEEAKNNKLVIKPHREQESAGCKGSVSSDLMIYIVPAIVAIAFVAFRRKEKE